MADLAIEGAVQTALRSSKALQTRGSLIQALTALEQVLPSLNDVTLAVAWPVVKRVATLCNRLATGRRAMAFLRRAEIALLEQVQRQQREKLPLPARLFQLLALTWNNLATWHKQRGGHHTALQYLLRASKLSAACEHLLDADSLHTRAQTKLNMAALFSELGRHPQAVSHAEASLLALQREMTQRNETETKQPRFQAMIMLFVVAFYNIGVGEEAMGRKSEALEAYKNAVSIGSKHLTSPSPALTLAKQAVGDLLNAVEGFTPPRRPMHPATTAHIQLVSDIPTPVSPPSPPPRPTHTRTQSAKDLTKMQRSRTIMRAHSHRLLTPGPGSPTDLYSKPPFKEEARYYSQADLAKLKKRLEAGAKLKFVSSDQYFLTKITKTLNVTRDMQHLRPMSASKALEAWELAEEEKRRVSTLRLKRHPPSGRSSSQHGLEVAMKLIGRLKGEDENIAKTSQIRHQSRMKTKAYRKTLENLQMQRNMTQSFPLQRLFFRPPHSDSSPERSLLPADPHERPISKGKLSSAKEEIEKMMDEINSDLRKMADEREPEMRGSEGKKLACELAHSTGRLRLLKQRDSLQVHAQVQKSDVERLAATIEKKRSSIATTQRSNTYKSPVAYPY